MSCPSVFFFTFTLTLANLIGQIIGKMISNSFIIIWIPYLILTNLIALGCGFIINYIIKYLFCDLLTICLSCRNINIIMYIFIILSLMIPILSALFGKKSNNNVNIIVGNNK